MTGIRAFRPEDLHDLYRIYLATALAGGDASGLYQDRKLVGHVYAGPYAVLSPETVFVIRYSRRSCRRPRGSCGAHLAVGVANLRAIGFYRACGFRELGRSPPVPAGPLWFGISLGASD
jgi:hypothetical protein